MTMGRLYYLLIQPIMYSKCALMLSDTENSIMRNAIDDSMIHIHCDYMQQMAQKQL